MVQQLTIQYKEVMQRAFEPEGMTVQIWSWYRHNELNEATLL